MSKSVHTGRPTVLSHALAYSPIALDEYAQVWSKVRVVKDEQRSLEEASWQVDGVLVENGVIVSHTEYVANWYSQEGAIKYGVGFFLAEMRAAGIGHKPAT